MTNNKLHRPQFANAWAASRKIYDPVDPSGKVAKVIGGRVADNIQSGGWKNTCAVRISFILNQSGLKIPRLGNNTVSGADHHWYFYRVPRLIEFLTQIWGQPDLITPYPVPGGGVLAGKRGIILFQVSGWLDAAGHATLWDGHHCYDHCYFNEPGAKYRTTAAYFWSLP